MSLGQTHRQLTLPESLQVQLHEFRRQVWTIKLIESVCGALFGILVAFGATFVLDRIFDTPAELRLAIFVGAILACAMVPLALHRWVWRHRLLTQLARLLSQKHPSVGDVRGLGVFWAIELVKDRQTREPLVPYNAAGADAKPMADLAAACKAKGLWPFTHFNRLHVVPPCNTPVHEVRQGLAIIDEALAVADSFVTG